MKHILVVGDAGVGKTQYINKKLNKHFESRYVPTLGGIKSTQGNGPVTYHEWPGQETYKFTDYHKLPEQVDVIIYLYDCTSRMSYNNIENWVNIIKKEYEIVPPSILVGNKFELGQKVKVVTRNMFWCKNLN
jgi:GTPase SAR1 family protein